MEVQQRKNGKRLVFSETSYHHVTQILDEFLRRSQAQLAIFADMNGYPVASRGDAENIDMSALTALAAGDFAATAEMASIIGHDGRFKFIYHEGTTRSIYLCAVSEDYFLLVVYETRVALGIIRVLSHYAVEKIGQHIHELSQESEQTQKFLDFEFRDLLSKQLERSLRPK